MRTLIERAGLADVLDLAAIKCLDALERTPTTEELGDFADDLAAWWRQHESTHFAFLARDEHGAAIGAAWLALVPRVPRPGALQRLSADVQSVFVSPDHRGAGVGSLLVAAAVEHAEELGVTRVTVHSSEGAISLYERLGFHTSPRLRQQLKG